MRAFKSAAFGVALGLLVAEAASAAIITTTYTGQVSDSSAPIPGRGGDAGFLTNIDYFGFFGPAGASLRGATFSAVFITDESTPGATAYYFNPTPTGPGSVIERATTATIHIGSSAFSLTAPAQGALAVYTNSFVSVAANRPFCNFFLCPGITQSLYLAVQGDGSDPFLPPPNYYYTEFSHDVSSSDYVHSGGFFAQDRTGTMFQSIGLEVLRIDNAVTGTVSPPYPPPPHIPEPSTWVTMLIGFGGMGAAFRMARRRARTAIHTAEGHSPADGHARIAIGGVQKH